MDTVLIQRHGHSVSPAENPYGLKCDACDGSSCFGNYCHVCKFTVHTKCGFLFYMGETLEHPSHVGHRLKLLTTGAPRHTDPTCHLCSKSTKCILFHCSTCKLNLDIDCMLPTICAQAKLKMPWHPHPLLILDFDSYMFCDVCGMKWGDGYFCPQCKLAIHKECVSVFESPTITHHCHVRHPLKLLTDGAPNYTNRKCHICADDTQSLLYHCDICKFNLDFDCIRDPPASTLTNLKVHEHTLTLMPKLFSFVCDACGTEGKEAPYVCLQCDAMIFHQWCTILPRVIHVNHHDHRVSYTYPLGHRGWRCGVCWEEIDWSYGAYSCSCCSNYAIHSLCAIRSDVWDNKELEGVAEEVEDIEPFKRNDDNTITHAAHEHNMSFNTLSQHRTALDENILCGACVRPIGSNTFYNCSDCSFILHETCAELPLKRRHFLSSAPLTLKFGSRNDARKCDACQQCCCNEGFMYDYNEILSYDLLCSLITVPFIHGSHPHPLFYLKLPKYGDVKTCQGCGFNEEKVVMGCSKCDFFLDFRCATLPTTVRLYRYDDHPLALCYGENGEKTSGKYWCDICERETDPKSWFYTCDDCGVTLHVLCVLGDLRYTKPGGTIGYNDAELLPNDRSLRPLCNYCYCRCPCPFILKDIDNKFLCSWYCMTLYRNWKDYWSKLRCPPWALEAQRESEEDEQ